MRVGRVELTLDAGDDVLERADIAEALAAERRLRAHHLKLRVRAWAGIAHASADSIQQADQRTIVPPTLFRTMRGGARTS